MTEKKNYQMNLIFSVIVVVLFIIVTITAEVTSEDAKKLTIKQLRSELKKRGLECKGCGMNNSYKDIFSLCFLFTAMNICHS